MTKPANPFRYYNSSPKIIRLAVVMHLKFPLSLRKASRPHRARSAIGSLGP